MERIGAFGVRRAMALAEWRARREMQADLRRSQSQVYRGFVQINLIRVR